MIKKRNHFTFDAAGISSKVFLSVTFALLLMLISGCSDQEAAGEQFSMPPMPVEVAKVKVQNVADQFEAVGTIEAIEAITVVSEIDAAIVSLPFEEGSYVKSGELIAQLDDSQLAAEVQRTEALFTQSKANYNRSKTLVEQKVGTPQSLDNAAADLKVAEANLEIAKARLNKTRIIAPFSGMVGSRRVSVGAFLRAGEIITELANIDEIRVTLSLPERFLSELKRGSEVTVSTSAYPDRKVKGKVVVIEPVVDPSMRTARVVVRLPNPGRKFLPGMSANVSVVLSERPNALTIPSESVFASGNQSFVFIVKPDSTVARSEITLGTQLPEVVEVVKGLKEGEQVVKAGHQKLFDGAKVMPVTTQDTTKQ
ncbi:MAG: efflux RND transporter periplasmic adaptor subunit [Ignavibacteria bacterium]|nr:efflux RND transporter periplasmic adaptor subunit [Ignavibacteria bacterium]